MDMTKCTVGDKLLLRNKHIATYIRKIEENTEPDKHIIKDDDSLFDFGVSDTGTYFVTMLSLNDVVGFATKENEENNIKLIDKVLETIKADVINGDVTAIEVLLKSVPMNALQAYLPNET